MVDEKIGPGELNTRLIQSVKDFFPCAGAVALRSPGIALRYALASLELPEKSTILISALAPSWQILAVEQLGYVPAVLDVDENTGLVTPEAVSVGIKEGGRLLLLHETMGILPDMNEMLALGIPVIEDVSQSAGAVFYGEPAESVSGGGSEQHDWSPAPAGKKAGTFGIFTILGLEEHDSITGGGGAVLLAPGRRDWVVLKKNTDTAPAIDLLPDINSALAWVQLREFQKNETVRKEIFSLYQRSLLSGRCKTYMREPDDGSAASLFPVIISGSYKDVRQYAERKDIEVRQAYADSVIALRNEELAPGCRQAQSLLLRCVLFPLYPRLGKTQTLKIAKVLGTLP